MTFNWGAESTFKAVCTQLTVAYKLFRPNGDPIRADVKMTLKQAEAASTASSNGANRAGNPTTRAQRRPRRAHGQGRRHAALDRLRGLRRRRPCWRAIAEANGIENPLHLRRGRSLSLPKLEG